MNKKSKPQKKTNTKIISFVLLLIYIIITGCSTHELTKNTLNTREQNIADSIKNSFQTGDLVQIVRGREKDNGKWVGHFGLIILDKNGKPYLLHSTPPKVKIQPLMNYVNNGLQSNIKKRERNAKIVKENKKILKYNDKLKNSIIRKHIFKPKKKQRKKTYFYGLKFLRLNTDPLQNLKK